MKLQKEKKWRQHVGNRWYDDACGTAFALELIGERWSILIMRELMFGPRRFSQLRAGLPGISAKILTQRLDGLEALRILQKRQLPPPVSAQVYELTEWGYEAEDIVQMLGKWATRHPGHDPTLPLSAASIIMSFRTMFDAERAAGFNAKAGFRLGTDRFIVTIGNGEIETQRGDTDGADFTITGEAENIAAIVYGKEPVQNLESAGLIIFEGDRKLAQKFITLFPLPEKF
ncbi:winged helix-turn-helix transcriptional regulator [Parasphingorhabdus halotolerans]|uniref:Transcriptional regulator n=1 Tax=Parasphingorhabdus halotolerans TaxID=2725558 RepID=A0A6H2DPP1_9SPHN|nr:winged helix-turn-helix transcriptional regulator [Parasphingorhabdus halotolerans]QJB69636.1 transcriptional regulator [Parasphingorhabdus halotolerans]